MALNLVSSRIEALSDGVFAIAMTLLVLKLEVPEVSHHMSNREMLTQLSAQLPAFISFVSTFVIAAGFWLLHHLTFHFIRQVDGLLCWINLMLLMFVSLLPFSAGMMGHLFVHSVSQVFYFGNHFAIAVLLSMHWWYATHAKMARTESDPVSARSLTYRIGVLPIAFGGAIAAAFLAPTFSMISFVVIFLGGFVIERMSRTRERRQ